MTPSPNPYEAPRAAAEPAQAVDAPLASCGDVRRGATLVVVFDAGRAVLWRTAMAVSMAYPSDNPALFGSRSFSIAIKLLGAGGILAGILLLTRPSHSGVRLRASAWARASGGLAVLGHIVRLVLEVSGANRRARGCAACATKPIHMR